MADAIVVLNAGSSSLKFSVFVARGGRLEPDLRGNIEEINTAPRFLVKDRAGHVWAEKSWGEGAGLGHEGALASSSAPSLTTREIDVSHSSTSRVAISEGGEALQLRATSPNVMSTLSSSLMPHAAVQSIGTYNLTYAGKPICFRRLLSNADSGTNRRSRLTWRAVRPAA